MPRRHRRSKRRHTRSFNEILATFKWSSAGDGVDSLLPFDVYPFADEPEARGAWAAVRRQGWLAARRGSVPPAAIAFDGLTCDGLGLLQSGGDLSAARAAVERDRVRLAEFRTADAAGSIGDVLDLFAADLDRISMMAADGRRFDDVGRETYGTALGRASER